VLFRSPIEIVPCPTVREPDGLALSSRNKYLSSEQRIQATVLNRTLLHAAERVSTGERNAKVITDQVRKKITESGPCEIEYVEVVEAESLAPLETITHKSRICLAVKIDVCRLIDNVGVDPSSDVE